MKVAILADIHGNLQALEAVLKDISQLEVDRVIVNGDLVNRGPSNVEVLESLWNESFIFTLGNHDDLVCKWQDRAEDLPQSWFEDPFWKATAWVSEQLARANWLPELRTLPMIYRLEPELSPSVLVSHGSPRHYREGYSNYLPDDDVLGIATAFPADIFVGSHTHSPLDRKVSGVRLLNTGAVGSPFNGDKRAQYLIMHQQKESWQAEFRALHYDHEAALKAYETSGMLEEGGLSAYIFREEVRYARSLFTPFFMWTEAEGVEQSWDTWARFKQAKPERFASLS
ncbi:MAG: metallophosphoesterase family protein [Trueperaceae bacterium]|nr:metallophosphoesterase family protein [Trueperaceae bacterium]